MYKVLWCLTIIWYCFTDFADEKPVSYSFIQTYYVSVDGDDNQSGLSHDQSLASIQSAINKMSENDTCVIKGGIYREHLKINHKKNLVFVAEHGAQVIVTGLDEVESWISNNDGVCQSTFVPQEKDRNGIWHLSGKGKLFTQFFLDGQPLNVAANPNLPKSLLSWDKRGADLSIFPDQRVKFAIPELNSKEPNQWKGGVFHAIVERKWNAVQGEISDHGVNELKCVNSTNGWGRGLQGVYNKNLFTEKDGIVSGIGKGFIIHHKNAMDTTGEWFWDKENNTVYVKMSNGKYDMTDHCVEMRSRKFGLSIRNSDGIDFRNIKFKAAGVEVMASENCVLNNVEITYATPFYTHFDEFNGKAMVSIIGGKNNVLKNSYVAHSWGSGVDVLKGLKNRVENCIVEDVNWMGTYNGCLRISGNGTEIIGNTLRNSGRFLIYAFDLKKAIISYNDIYNGMLVGQDGGAFYTHAEDGDSSVISYNWIHDIKGIPWERSKYPNHNISVGVYLDGGCQNFNVHHNVIWNMEYGVLYNASVKKGKKLMAQGNTINYNTVYAYGKGAIISKNLPLLYKDNEVSYNLVNKKIGALSQKEGNRTDYKGSYIDRYFKKSKQAPDEKKVKFVVDEDSNEIEVGAYEKGITKWKPGAKRAN